MKPQLAKESKQSKSMEKSGPYHLAILLSAVAVLVVGGMWRGGRQVSPAQDPGITALETLREQVSGLQSVLRRSELQSINDVMVQITTKTSGWIVSVKPAAARESFRKIGLYDPPPTNVNAVPSAPELAPGLSGLVIDQEGYILTSASVLKFEAPFQVLRDRSTLIADLKSVDGDSYLALLKIREVPIGGASLAGVSARELGSGEWVIRHGRSPAGRESRSIAVLESVRTTSAGMTMGMLDSEGSPEMDGSALLSESGEIVGIYVKPTDTRGMVVPIHAALEIAARLKAQVISPRLRVGFTLQDLSSDLKDYFALDKGVLITRVEAGSPASKSGLRPKDVIGKINGQEIVQAAEVMNMLSNSPPGIPLDLEIRRNSRTQNISLAIEQPASESGGAETESGDPILHLRLIPSPVENAGLIVTEIQPISLANRLGIKAGDVMQSINNTRLRTVDQFSGLQRRRSRDTAQLWEIQRAGQVFFVAVKEPADVYE